MSVTEDLKHALEVPVLNIGELQEHYPAWHLWLASEGSPVATRLSSTCPPRGQRTLVCRDMEHLEAELARQDELGEGGPGWDIFFREAS